VSSLPKAVTWKRTGRDSNRRPFGSRANALQLRHTGHVTCVCRANVRTSNDVEGWQRWPNTLGPCSSLSCLSLCQLRLFVSRRKSQDVRFVHTGCGASHCGALRCRAASRSTARRLTVTQCTASGVNDSLVHTASGRFASILVLKELVETQEIIRLPQLTILRIEFCCRRVVHEACCRRINFVPGLLLVGW